MEDPKRDLMLKLYQQLGALFFLVANADKKIRKAEVKALNEIVERVWLDYDDTYDNEGRDTAWQIEDTFGELIVQPKNNKEILADFKHPIQIRDSVFALKGMLRKHLAPFFFYFNFKNI